MSHPTRSLRTLLALLLLALGLTLVGCGGGDTTDDGVEGEPSTGSETPDDGDTSAAPDDGDTSAAPDDGSCPEGGHTPVEGEDGVPQDCEVLYDGCCFDAARACEVAGCTPDDCQIAESYPGQVSCGG